MHIKVPKKKNKLKEAHGIIYTAFLMVTTIIAMVLPKGPQRRVFVQTQIQTFTIEK
jgi:hypothetical protein